MRKTHTAAEFDLDVLSGDTDMFRWFLLCYLFGKPIQSGVAVATWKLFIEKKLDTPWAIVEASDRKLVTVLHDGGLHPLSARYGSRASRMYGSLDSRIRGVTVFNARK